MLFSSLSFFSSWWSVSFLQNFIVFSSFFAILPKRGKEGEKRELHPKAASCELLEDKHHATYVDQSKTPEHANLSASLSCS